MYSPTSAGVRSRILEICGWILLVITALFCLCSVVSAADVEPVFTTLPPYVGDGRKAPPVSNMEIKELIIPKLEIPSLEIPQLQVPSLEEAKPLEIQQLDIPQLKIESIQDAIDKAYNRSNRALLKMILDQRSALDSKLYQLSEDDLKQWVNIYNDTIDSVYYVQPPKGLRMIAEVRMPQSEEQAKILQENLNYRHAQGFNAVLVTFSGSEDVNDLVDLVTYLKKGFSVWFAFGGHEDLKEPVFMSPEKYGLYLQSLAYVSSGFLSHWRRTSSHLFIQDEAFMFYTALNVRAGNPNIPILGEVYFGETAPLNKTAEWYKTTGQLANHIKIHLVIRMVKGGSGYVLTNFGYPNIDVDGVMHGLLKPVQDSPKYVLISGPYPYFLTTHKRNTSYEEDLQGIEDLEKSWTRAGVWGTIVTHADGTDSNGVSDNMSAYSYKSIKADVTSKP